VTLKGDSIAAEFQKIVEQYVNEKYPDRSASDAKQKTTDTTHA
jgi:hypothetical protein